MKRFTATEKWDKEWFQDLPLKQKCLWFYLCDKCDNAGIIEPNLKHASFILGTRITEADLKPFGDRVMKLRSGKLILRGFVEFQYGKLNEKIRPHQAVMRTLKRELIASELSVILEGASPSPETLADTLAGNSLKGSNATHKEKDKDKDKEKDGEVQEGEIHTSHARVALLYLNEMAGRAFRETAANLTVIDARLKEPGVDIDGVKRMIDRQCARWKGTEWDEYLQPSTLFGKEKFDNYYSAKDLPLPGRSGNGKPPQPTLLDKELERI